MASLMETIKSDVAGRIVVFVFGISTAGLLFYFDVRDLTKEQEIQREELREVRTELREYKQLAESMRGILSVVQDMKEEQKEIRKDQKDMQKEMYNFFQGFQRQ